MHPVTEQDIRTSFVNASRREATQAILPELDTVDWESLDYLGWTDAKRPNRSYVVLHLDSVVTSILLRPASGTPTRRKAICVWCQDIEATENVRMVVASLAGAAGRRGATVGVLACTDFSCSRNVRRAPTVSEVGDRATPEEKEFWTELRIEGLRDRIAKFARRIQRDA
ncbi:FBP domain-containing protein [Kytococcus schroeteri]|uniref:FBP domain-containing protein n=1 Tax=Kytococcus schroeteri TaxID=138300 RepID=A0A2I1PAX0_9MICO|nr:MULTISPECIES: FBP domain-containing protein [Kytococcus]OFS08478.1 translation elongation factor [Kytococcus sp. HMSC28H12]PKZ41767.1 FBP domain-containing protein [Kytococcus schroeteri]